MSELGERILELRERLAALERQCTHIETRNACPDPNSAKVCVDCGHVVSGGVLSISRLGPE